MTTAVRKCVVVTGAAAALGAVLSERFAWAGASLVLVDVDDEGLNKLASRLESKYAAPVITSSGDSGTGAASEAVLQQAISAFGVLDVLVHNCGGKPPCETLNHTEHTQRATINHILGAAIRNTLLALPAMLKGRGGRVIFIAADPTGDAVCRAAFGGVVAFVRAMADEFRNRDVTFNVVVSGALRTPGWGAVTIEQWVGEMLGEILPPGTGIEMSEIAALVEFLAGDVAGGISGQIIKVDRRSGLSDVLAGTAV